MNCKLTDFATYEDLVAYIKCRDHQGGTPQSCLAVGDNGEGASGKTTATDDVPMCALPASQIRARWGSTAGGWGKKVVVKYGVKTIECELADIGPEGVCDLNPCALALIGEKHPFSGNGSWEWKEPVAVPVPTPPKPTQHYAIYSESALISFSDVQRIAAACHAQASGELKDTWGKRVAVSAVPSQSDVPLGHYRVIIKDDIGADGAFGYHTDEHGQPICYVKAQDPDNTCVTCSHEILEASVDAFGNRFIVIDLPPYGKVRCLVEIADPPESFAYADHGLQVSDFILPEWYDESVTTGLKYSYKGHIKTPQTILEGGYFSFMTANGQWYQQTWWSGSQPIFEGPFNWQRRENESQREMVDRETRARRPA